MPETQRFVIRRTFLLPLGLLLLLALTLFTVCLVQDEPRAKVAILGFIILPVAGLFVECLFRRVLVDQREVTAVRLLRRKRMAFSDMTAVESVLVRKRAFLTLCADDDFIILSNAYADFPAMVHTLLSRAPAAAISAETREMAKSPPVKSTDIVSCWLAVALLALILFIQLGGSF